MTTMKENIPIPQKMDTESEDPLNHKIPLDDTASVDDVAKGNSSGKKRAAMEDDSNEAVATESNDTMQDDNPPRHDSTLEVAEQTEPKMEDTLKSTDRSGSDEQSQDVGSPAEESVEEDTPSQKTENEASNVESAVTPTIDLQRPVKRARTAYFLFMEDHRAETQKQHPGEGVGSIARILGQRWGEMTDEEKQPYHAKAALEKQRVATETELWKQAARAAGKDLSIVTDANAGESSSASTSNGALILPVGRVRKICRLDPEVRGISKEALVIITKATERFAIHLGRECVKTAHIQNRRTLLPQDVVDVCQIRECFQFLKDDIQDLHRHQQQMNAEMKASSSNAAATKGKGNRSASVATVSTKPLTDYFKPAV